METLFKAVITGALQFVAPGTVGQAVTGMAVSYLYKQFFNRAAPYCRSSDREVGRGCNLVLFLFFVMAIVIKAGVSVTGAPARDAAFNAAAVGILSCAVFVLPVLAVARCGFRAAGEPLRPWLGGAAAPWLGV